MRSILEQAIHLQLNGEGDKATELFHSFVVAKARQIHESLRNGEDPLSEGWDDAIDADTYFTEEDLESLEDDNDDMGDDMGDDMADDVDMGDDMADGDVDMDGDVDTADVDDLADDLDTHEEEDQDLADEVDELSAKLAELEARFAELSGEDADEGYDVPAVDTNDDDDFDRLGESVVDDMDKVDGQDKVDGKEIGTGGSFGQNKTSGLPQKKIGERQGGKPIEMKSTNHNGFEREAAPAVAEAKPRKNTLKKAATSLSSVKGGAEKGEGKELGGKAVTKNTKSVLSDVNKK